MIYKLACVQDLLKTALFGERFVAPVNKILIDKAMKAKHNPVLGQKIKATYLKDLSNELKSPQFDFITKKIHLNDLENVNPSILAHEAGHLENHKTIAGKLVQNLPVNAAHALVPTAGLAGGIYSGYTSEESGTSPNTVRDIAIGAGMSAPVLAGEAAASVRGHNILKQHGATVRDLVNYRKAVVPAFGTYLSSPAAGLINYGIGRQIGGWFAKKPVTKNESL